ncbi:hypothetical protein TPAR_01252 [Tolypocladium paradoxum]|uniref:Azaphilone pigments biosynthesis cluster protein L N-terminal domain-containing protein n=1 Tax=Tolypocladium paradoxum TaxID=94208 RepID=A0A2S4L7Y2_9HYPO|nr:hypothetical protein TPAR_01252 [Tolypocladium paradoxum]
MEAVGAGASTLAFVLLGLKSAKIIHDALSTIKDAPKTVRELAQDIQFLQSVLERLSRCSLGDASSGTVVSLRDMLQTCTAELSGIEARITQFSTRPSSSRSRRVYKGLLAFVKEKDLEEARNRIRDKATQANLYLNLIQAQTISETSSSINTQASATTGILQQILGEVARLHERLDSSAASSTAANPVGVEMDTDYTSNSVVEGLEAMTLCSELEESISRLSSLVDHDGLTLDANDAEQITDDLQRLIRLAKDKVYAKETGSSKAPANANTMEEDSRLVRRDLKLIEGLILSAPRVAINQSGIKVPNSNQLLADLPGGTVIKQKRLREEINVNYGYFTITTNKRRRICRAPVPDSSGNASSHGDVMANLMFRPSDSSWMFTVSVSQGQLFDRSTQSIPRISVSPILPNDSLVFRLVQEGRLDDFRILLDEGKASLRDHDEQGMPLLHYAATGSTQMCKFLIESGADVDEMGEHSGTALSHIMGLGLHDRMLLLLENMADPTLSFPGWDNPLSTACSSDMPSVELFLKHGGHFALDDFEGSDMNGRTRLHQVCMAESRSTSKLKAVAMLVAAGAKITARIVRSWSADDHQTLGFTCLHSLVYKAQRTENRDDLETLVFLIQHGADTSALDHHQNTVSMRAYLSNEDDNYHCSKGSYRGDLWDAALTICGHDLDQFRTSYPRVPRYNKRYSREDFERLWWGNEHLCPYWDDRRYPETGGNDDYWRRPPQRCDHTSCSDCEEYHASFANAEPDTKGDDSIPLWSRDRHPRSPSLGDPEYSYDEHLTWGKSEESDRESSPEEELSYWTSVDKGGNEEEESYDRFEDDISLPYSEDGEVAYQRLMGEGNYEEGDLEVGTEYYNGDALYDYCFGLEMTPPCSEDVEEAYWRLMGKRDEEGSRESPSTLSGKGGYTCNGDEVHRAENES